MSLYVRTSAKYLLASCVLLGTVAYMDNTTVILKKLDKNGNCHVEINNRDFLSYAIRCGLLYSGGVAVGLLIAGAFTQD
jgi:hypothetical protein